MKSNLSMVKAASFALLATAIYVAEPGSASADASGVAGWGAVSINVGGQSIGIPTGIFTHNIEGSGNRIGLQSAFFSSSGTMSNWRIDWINIDVYGRQVNRSYGPIHYSSDRNGDRISDFRPGSVPVAIGTACAALVVSGQEIVRQCHAITP